MRTYEEIVALDNNGLLNALISVHRLQAACIAQGEEALSQDIEEAALLKQQVLARMRAR